MTIWAVGGEQRVAFRKVPEWTMFRKALVVRVGDDGSPEPVLEYESPPEHRPDEKPSFVFKAGAVAGERAYLCTQTEVLVCDFPSFRIRRVISLPCFNDLHHVAPGPEGTLWVVVTGLDAVAEVTAEGELVRLVSVFGGSPWDEERFSPDVDYRKIPTTKPHRSHPNYVFFVGGRPWVTRFAERAAMPLDGAGEPWTAGTEGGIHDGHVHRGEVYLTSVDGHVVRFDLRTGEKRDLDLNELNPYPDQPLGWCRGLLPVEDGTWVGFTRIRYTRLRQNLSWIRHGFQESEDHRYRPTRLALYDLDRPRLLREIDLEPAGMGAVFSIHDESG